MVVSWEKLRIRGRAAKGDGCPNFGGNLLDQLAAWVDTQRVVDG